jgi:hypothetical protein
LTVGIALPKMSGVAFSALLWDFGDTLVDERWMHWAPVGFPQWSTAWVELMGLLATPWNVGRIREQDVFDAMAERTGMDAVSVERHAEQCCRSLVFNPATWRLARLHHFPQALVTVNPDLFLQRIVPRYRLGDIFDVIVVSCEEATEDKVVLCERALERLSFRGRRRDALLIDNREDVVNAWHTGGGTGHCYRGDEPFKTFARAHLQGHPG